MMFSARWAHCKTTLPKIDALFTFLPLIPQTFERFGTGKSKPGLCGVSLKVAPNGAREKSPGG